MTKLKSPGSKTAADSELIATIEEQSAELRLLRKEVAEWKKKYEKGDLRDIAFTNSEREVQPIYTPLDAAETDAERGNARFYPYPRRSPYGYRGRLWTMRQFAGFGSARDTNSATSSCSRTGRPDYRGLRLSNLMGLDSDHPRSEGEVGKCGVAISSLADMETLFDGIPLDQVSTSMTINGPAVILYCFYIAAAEKKGVDSTKLRGTIQNDILKEYMAQHAWVYPIEPALRLIVDCFEWSAERPAVEYDIDSGYHIREAGATAAQELAFTLADGFTYVERGIARASTSTPSRRGFRFLGHPQRLLRGDRQASRRATDLGATHEEALRCQGSALAGDALSLADRRRDADRPAADEQRDPGRLPGDGGRAGRNAVAPHQLDGRDAGVAD